jgi:hypothetical protein
MMHSSFDVSTFLDHLIYKWLENNYFPGLLFTVQDVSSFRQAVVSGMALPVTCMFRASPPSIETEVYGRSVLKRTVMYDGLPASLQLRDYLVKYSFFTAGYVLTDINEVYQKVLNLDMERYFEFDMSNLYPPKARTKVEFKKTSQDFKPDLNDDQQMRKFYTSVDWELRITLPCLDAASFIERVNLFINEFPVATIGG